MAAELKLHRRDVARKNQTRREINELWRLGIWGCAAAIAVAIVGIASQVDFRGHSMQLAFKSSAPVQMAAVPPKPQPVQDDSKIRAMEAQMSQLATERERLNMRLAELEQKLDDVTGSIHSIEKQAAQAPPKAESSSQAPIPSPPAVPIINPLAMALPTEVTSAWPESEQTAEEKPTDHDTQTEKVILDRAPPLPAGRIIASAPLPKIASAPMPKSEPALIPVPAGKTEFGIELASGTHIDALRARWAGIKANAGPMLAGLQPVAVRENHAGNTTYRLIAGPLPNFAIAEQTCTRFNAAHIVCRPARFNAQNVVQH